MKHIIALTITAVFAAFTYSEVPLWWCVVTTLACYFLTIILVEEASNETQFKFNK